MPGLDRLSDLKLFASIVSTGSLSGAAREHGLSLAVVSARLSRLESALGVTLLQRSTRRLGLTDDGRLFFQRVEKIIHDVADLEDMLGASAHEPHGVLRVTSSAAFGRRHIAPQVAAFRRKYPAVTLDLIATDTAIDIIQEGIDVAIRQSELPDSNMMTRNLISNRRIACASPSYLKNRPPIRTPHDIKDHDCIVMGVPPMTRWPFTQTTKDESISVNVTPCFQTNDGEAAHAAALDGAGIALKSRIDVLADLTSGYLVDVLPKWRSPGSPIHAVYPASRYQPSKVRVFIDFLAEHLAPLGEE